MGNFGGVWILAEQRNGKIRDVSYELLSWGRDIADKLQAPLVAVVLGSGLKKDAESFIFRGADEVIAVDEPPLAFDAADAHSAVLEFLARKHKPEVFIALATTYGRTVMPMLAVKLETGLTADCTSLDVEGGTRLLIQTRPAIGGNVMATIKTPFTKPQMATVRPGARKPPKEDKTRIGKIVFEKVPESLLKSSVKLVGFVKDETSEIPLQEADVVVAGGKGMKNAKSFEMLFEIAELLNGAVGASRQAVDMGWISYAHQIGLSGKTVNPKLYIAAGISGAVQHIAGMSSSRCIVAINKDPDANIFKVADFGITGDLFEILPLLIKALKEEGRKNERI